MKKIKYVVRFMAFDGKMQVSIPLMIMVLSFLVVVFMGMECYDRQKEKVISGIQDEIIFVAGDECKQASEIKDKLPGVKQVHQIKYVQTRDGNDIYSVFVYDEYMIERVKSELYKGRKIENENEILINKKLAKRYDIGDTIKLYYRLPNGSEEAVRKTVCGIVQEDVFLYSNASGNLDYSMLITEAANDDYYMPEKVIAVDEKMAMTDKTEYKVYYLEAEGSVDKELLKKWKKETKTMGRMYLGSAIFKEAKEARMHTQENLKLFIGSSMVLGIITFIGIGLVSNIRYKNETGILLLCGANRMECFFMIHICKIILGLTGFFVGNAFGAYLLKQGHIIGVYKYSFSVCAFMVSFFMYISSVAISNSVLKKYSINQLIRISKG